MKYNVVKAFASSMCIVALVGCDNRLLQAEVEGQGVISSTLGEIDCGGERSQCQASFILGQAVELQATAEPGYLFSSWQRLCEDDVENCEILCQATEQCTVTMTEDITLKATFVADSGGGTTAKVLMNFNTAEGETWPEWSYGNDVSGYGAAGYLLTGNDPNVGEATSTAKISNTRMMDKTDYGAGNVLSFVSDERAPGTAGASAYFESGSASDNQISWWMWYDNYPLQTRGITDVNTDRMSFYLKIEGMADNIGPDGGSNYGFHVGTYDCAVVDGGCPYEGPGNQHYYHYLGLNSGAWIHVELDEQPQHWRGIGRPQLNNPVATAPEIYSGYYANMHQFYMEIRSVQDNPTQMWLDEITYRSTSDGHEPKQNQQSITSVWVGYWQQSDQWQISWSDEWQDRSDNTNSTFEVRYSLDPITNANFEQATPVQPLYYTGPDYESSVSEYAIRRPNSYTGITWTAFHLPDAVELSGQKLYFAIKDISVAGGNAGLMYPFNRTDGKNPPNNFIRSIDYIVP